MSILSKQEIKEAKKNMELADKCCKNLSAIVLAKRQKEQCDENLYPCPRPVGEGDTKYPF